jgi:site-specific recombinase XerD
MLARFNVRYQTPHRNRVMVRFMIDAGLRVGELVALRPEHLNMMTCQLVVRDGKGARDRVLWISADLRDEVGEWLERRPTSSWLFPTRDGDPVSTRYVRSMVKRMALKAGLPEADRITPHTLRHTFATQILRQTRNIRTVQEALGHSSVSTTQIYTHLVNGEVEDAMRHVWEPEPDTAAPADEVMVVESVEEGGKRKRSAARITDRASSSSDDADDIERKWQEAMRKRQKQRAR